MIRPVPAYQPGVVLAPVAQRIEQRFSKPSVAGSNPAGSALLNRFHSMDFRRR
jgi:hypothetical protein